MRSLLVALVFAGCCPEPAAPHVAAMPPPAPAPPVAEPPAFDPPLPTLRLPRHFAPTHVTARLAVDPSKPRFDGEIAIDGTLDRRSAAIWMHASQLEIERASATSNGTTVALTTTLHGEFLELRPAQPLDAGPWTLQLAYRGSLVQDGFQGVFVSTQGADRYVTTQFEASAARMAFPCFDEPDFKVPWQLTLDVPSDQNAVSNTPVASTTKLDAGHSRIVFAPTRPLPSYLVAFGIGPYEILDAGKARSGLPLRVVAPRGRGKDAMYLVNALPRIVDFLEGWFGIPFPYPKLDIVIVPSARGLAMENAGMITADGRYTLLSHPAPLDQYGLVSVIGHETAHQWFGDLVTADWWDDIWLNESFATWMEDKVLAAFDKTWPSEDVQHRQSAFDADELLSARKIHQPIDTLDSIHNVFDAITYPKGAIVLRMLEHEVGADKFQAAIHAYLIAHADGNANAADVFAAIEKVAPTPLGAVETSFFDQAGVPDIAMKLRCDGNKATIELAQRRFVPVANPPESTQRWTVPLCIAYEGPHMGRAEVCTRLDAPTGEVAVPGDRCPAWFAPAGDYGYYRVNLDAKAIDALLLHGWAMLTSAERIAILSHVWAHARTGAPSVAVVEDIAATLRVDADPVDFAVGFGDAAASGGGGNTGLPPGLDAAIPADLLPVARANVRAAVEPFAKKLGLGPGANDTIGTQLERAAVVGAVVWSRSHVLDAQAKQLVARLAELPVGVRESIATLAVDADPAIAERLRTALATEPDRANRDAIVRALGSIHDPKRHLAALKAVATAPTTNGEDLVGLFTSGDHEALLASSDYIRAHFDELLPKMPSTTDDDFPIALSLGYPLIATCDAARRDADTAFADRHLGKLPGAAIVLKQYAEANDHCIAQKQLLEPSLRTWLHKTR